MKLPKILAERDLAITKTQADKRITKIHKSLADETMMMFKTEGRVTKESRIPADRSTIMTIRRHPNKRVTPAVRSIVETTWSIIEETGGTAIRSIRTVTNMVGLCRKSMAGAVRTMAGAVRSMERASRSMVGSVKVIEGAVRNIAGASRMKDPADMRAKQMPMKAATGRQIHNNQQVRA